jgi:hypothetical protein
MHCPQKRNMVHTFDREKTLIREQGCAGVRNVLGFIPTASLDCSEFEAPVGSFTRVPPPENQQAAFNCTDLRSIPSIGGLSAPRPRFWDYGPGAVPCSCAATINLAG